MHAFVLPSVSEGRTLVELAERMDLTFDTVMIDEAWDVNTWTVGTDENYEARNYKLLYQYLEQDLRKPTPYDVIVLPSLHGWNRLPTAVREMVRKRVEQGTGLVLIHPTTGLPAPDDPKVQGPLNDFADAYEVPPGEDLWDLSPLVGALSDRLDARGFREIRPDAVLAGSWKGVGEQFITANLPLESFPTDYLKHYKYGLGKDSRVLVAGAGGEPIIATKLFGKGRVVALGYANAGLSPMIDGKILGQGDDHWWEYFYSLLCRSILWAAKREPPLTLGRMAVTVEGNQRKTLSVEAHNSSPLTAGDLTVQISNEWGDSEGSLKRRIVLKPSDNSATIELPAKMSAGRHFVDVILSANGKHYDWGSVSFEIAKSDEILSLSSDREFYTRGDKIQVTFTTKSDRPGNFAVELLDNRRRLLSRAFTSGRRAEIEVGNYSTNVGWVQVMLRGAGRSKGGKIDQKQLRVNFSALDRDFGAYELIMPWYGPPSYQPWTPTLDEQFRKIGVTVVETPERNFKIIKEINTPGFGVYWHYRKEYLEQKDRFLETSDKRYLIREPDLESDDWLEKLRGTIRSGMTHDKGFRPLAYYLADESSLTAYGDPFDLSWSAPTLAKFRTWLKTEFPSLAGLNEEWGSRFSSWEEVQPLTTDEARARDNYAGWMDHRTFMEEVFAQAVQVAADTVKQEDPGSRPSISGTQAPGPSNALNWYRLDQLVDYLQPYSEDDQDELHRSMHRGQILTGFTGYERHGKALRHELWHRLFHGQIGASLFWQYTALNADLSLTEQGRDLAKTVSEVRNEGLALLLRAAERENCGIAVHYSLLSVRSQWITDGHIQPHEVSDGDATSVHLKRFHANRAAWLQALEDAGYQYDFLATEQIEAGKLGDYKVLILPDSIALSDGEVAAIRKFVEGGGLLISDAETGLMDGHARWQTAGRLDDLLGVECRGLRCAPNAAPTTKLRLDVGDRPAEFAVLPANPALRVSAGAPGASVGDIPFLIAHRFGRGRSISFNFWMADYPHLRENRTQEPRLALLRECLSQGGVRPVADVRKSNGKPLACSEFIAFRRGNVKYLAILPGPKCEDAGTVTLSLEAPQHIYDLRAHRLVGRAKRVNGTLVPGEPLFYALMPTPVGHLSVSALTPTTRAARVKRGDTVKLSIRLTAPSVKAGSSRQAGQQRSEGVPESAVHVEVRDPSGKVVDYYGGTLPLSNGSAEFAVPLALNDRPGVWRVTAREPFTHQSAGVKFEVTR